MPNCPRVYKNLIIVPTLYHTARSDKLKHIKRGLYLEGLISEEVDFFKAFVFDVSEPIGLVPIIWKDVKRDLTADGIRQAIACKSLCRTLTKLFAHHGPKRSSG